MEDIDVCGDAAGDDDALEIGVLFHDRMVITVEDGKIRVEDTFCKSVPFSVILEQSADPDIFMVFVDDQSGEARIGELFLGAAIFAAVAKQTVFSYADVLKLAKVEMVTIEDLAVLIEASADARS